MSLIHNHHQNPTSHKDSTSTTTHPILSRSADSSSHPSLSPSPDVTPACAACQNQRRRCTSECILAPYFPVENQQIFLNAHHLFDVSNILKTLMNVDSERRTDAMRGIIIQSNARAVDPIGGCYRIALELQREINTIYAELLNVRSMADYYRSKVEASVANMVPVPQINPVDMHAHNLLLSQAATDEPNLALAAAQQQYNRHIHYDGQDGLQGCENGANAHDEHFHNSYGEFVRFQVLDLPMQMLSFQHEAVVEEVDVKPFVEILNT